jgi:dTDP-4-dehydrorhamnose 3,5-epimerase
MRVYPTDLPGVLLIEPRVVKDERGFFLETWHAARYHEAGIDLPFVQDNASRSTRGVLRGLHAQNPQAQGKLVGVLDGEVFDVAVDLRLGSPTFGKWFGAYLSAEAGRQMWIPPGFAHGFVVTSDSALFTYKCTAPYAPEAELAIRWDDPQIGIEWPLADPVLSPRDAAAPFLRDVPQPRLFAGAGPAG